MNVYTYKLQAKTCLAGRTGKAFGLAAARFMLSLLLGLTAYFMRRFALDLQSTAICLAGECALLFLSAWLLSALRQGALAWHIRCAEGKHASFLQVMYWLRRARSLKSRCLFWAVRIRMTGWFLLLNAPCFALLAAWLYGEKTEELSFLPSYTALGGAVLCGVVGSAFAYLLCQQYALCAYLLAKEPSLGVHETIRLSRRYMETNCGKLLWFKLTFLPWFLSCLFVLPVIYVVPYYRQSIVCRMADFVSAASFGCEPSAELPAHIRRQPP